MLHRLIEGLLSQVAAVAGTVAVILWAVLFSRIEKMVLLNAPEIKTYVWVCTITWLVAFTASQILRARETQTP